jgi:hypothetical protein
MLLAAGLGPGQTISNAQSAQLVPHDERYFPETDFRIDDQAMWSFFQTKGGVGTLGYPVSRSFTLLGCPVQIFQRHIVQHCPGRDPTLLNLLDPELFPYTQINTSKFPAVDQKLKAVTPKVDQPDYDERVLEFVRANVPDEWDGEAVGFGRTFFAAVQPERADTREPGLLRLLALEVWGAPISQPARDPSNPDFIYQRFQRGIMHFQASRGVTEGILLADYFKAILLGPEQAGSSLPADLREQARSSRFFDQYCPGRTRWLCRPEDLTDTDLSFAFDQVSTPTRFIATPTTTPAPVAGRTPGSTVTPTAVPIASSTVPYLEDSLTNSANPNDWAIKTFPWGGRIEFVRAGYQFFLPAGNNKTITGGFTSDTVDTRDIQIEVDAVEPVSSGSTFDSFGIVCRTVDTGSRIHLGISSDGHFIVAKSKDSENVYFPEFPRDRLPSTPPGVIRAQGAVNHIRADCVGNTFTLYVNGEKLGSVQDNEFKSGGFGLYASNREGSRDHTVLFRNIVVFRR